MSDEFTLRDDPFALFDEWLEVAGMTELNDSNAMALASVDDQDMPDVRIMLLNGHDARGFVFYTNLESAKARELRSHPTAAAVFHWKSLRRQVRLRGPVSRVIDAEADAHFACRPLLSRLGACASNQSRPLDSRSTLEARVRSVAERYPDGIVPRPSHWSGYRIMPLAIEFWQDRAHRLHDASCSPAAPRLSLGTVSCFTPDAASRRAPATSIPGIANVDRASRTHDMLPTLFEPVLTGPGHAADSKLAVSGAMPASLCAFRARSRGFDFAQVATRP